MKIGIRYNMWCGRLARKFEAHIQNLYFIFYINISNCVQNKTRGKMNCIIYLANDCLWFCLFFFRLQEVRHTGASYEFHRK